MHAKLSLSTQWRNGHTTLHQTFVSPPLKLLALPSQNDGWLRAVQMSSSPGLLNGDVIDIELNLAENTQLSLYTQSFTRVLSMKPGEKAEQSARIVQNPGSRLCYLPHPLVLHTGSSLSQRTEIELNDGCELLYGEIIAAGRVLRGEQFAFRHLSSLLTISHHAQPIVYDNIQWQPEKYPPDVLGQMEQYTHQLNVFYVHTAPEADIDAHIERVFAVLDGQIADNNELLWGISRAGGQVLCLRALGHHAEDLQNVLRAAASVLQPAQMSPVSAAFLR